MEKSTKPFPQNLNPIFLDTKNWVLCKEVQIKKSLARKSPKPNVFCVWHGQYCFKTHSTQYFPLVHGGKINLQKNKRKQKKQFICRNCSDLWRKWNRCGSQKIKTASEWVQFLNDQKQTDSDEKSDSDSDYIYEEDHDETKKKQI
ncbi:hypothetical protein M0813_17176 [Anaeramoeba flamelloides]|uniref:Uncharacterized protein n=1 Tax=Anaeramoeba flamelloides TaxID=1746091 RepID=A0ABQ8YXH2_9EUKA|nr:hypothetical protein M0813_17176 [Anaeramoeba flamelloides]